jgi:hypothetical protein
MPGYIQSGDKVGIGSAGGVNTSLNLMVNVKTSQTPRGPNDPYAQNEANSKPVALKKWFETYAISPGINTGVYTNVAWSEFKQATIFGCTIALKNETKSTYANSNNGGFKITPLFGSKGYSGTPNFTCTIFQDKGGTQIGSKTSQSTMTFQSPEFSFDGPQTFYIRFTNTHPSGAGIASQTFGFYWVCGYDGDSFGGGSFRSDPTDRNSFNLLNRSMDTIIPSGQAAGDAGSYTNDVTVLCKPIAYVDPT